MGKGAWREGWLACGWWWPKEGASDAVPNVPLCCCGDLEEGTEGGVERSSSAGISGAAGLASMGEGEASLRRLAGLDLMVELGALKRSEVRGRGWCWWAMLLGGSAPRTDRSKERMREDSLRVCVASDCERIPPHGTSRSQPGRGLLLICEETGLQCVPAEEREGEGWRNRGACSEGVQG